MRIVSTLGLLAILFLAVNGHSAENGFYDVEENLVINLFKALEDLDEKFREDEPRVKEIIEAYEDNFQSTFQKVFILERGIVSRFLDEDSQNPQSWMRLGSHHMFEDHEREHAVLFQDMLLSKETHFELVDLKTNLSQHSIDITLNLNTLSISGGYEICNWSSGPLDFLVSSGSGSVGVILEKPIYKARLAVGPSGNTITVYNVLSTIVSTDNRLELYPKIGNQTTTRVTLQEIESLARQIRKHLDIWISRYASSLLMDTVSLPTLFRGDTLLLNTFRHYYLEENKILNRFVDSQINRVGRKIIEGKKQEQTLPPMKFRTNYGIVINLTESYIEDLTSMYRADLAKASRTNNEIVLSVTIAFSKLKVFYHYDARIPQVKFPFNGMVIYDMDQSRIQTKLTYTRSPEPQCETLLMSALGPEKYSMTLQGSLNRYYTTVRHILLHPLQTYIEHHLDLAWSVMSMLCPS